MPLLLNVFCTASNSVHTTLASLLCLADDLFRIKTTNALRHLTTWKTLTVERFPANPLLINIVHNELIYQHNVCKQPKNHTQMESVSIQ